MTESQKQTPPDGQQKTTRMKYARIIGIVIIIFLFLGGVFAWGLLGQQNEQEAEVDSPPINLMGPADAPVKIVEYADFACGSCRAWHNVGVWDVLQEDFGDQISFEFRHYPVISLQSPKAAQAGQCAAEQGKFWEYHDYIYEQTEPGALSVDELNDYATAVGLDSSQFAECLESERMVTIMREHWNQALKDGARGTPTFFVNGTQTFMTYDALAAQIEAELAN
jgi:protein-disulfide isomerase